MAAVTACCAGLLWWNAAPAQVFMGDTGSLAIGTAIAVAALQLHVDLLIPIFGAVYLDGGSTQGAEPSSIVDLTRGVPCLLRAGVISLEQLREVVPELVDVNELDDLAALEELSAADEQAEAGDAQAEGGQAEAGPAEGGPVDGAPAEDESTDADGEPHLADQSNAGDQPDAANQSDAEDHAETDEEAKYLSKSMELTWLRLRQNMPQKIASPEEADAFPWTPEERRFVESQSSLWITGSPKTVKAALEEKIAETGADELMIATTIHDYDKRLESYRLLKQVWN
jgi:hypothetical protein